MIRVDINPSLTKSTSLLESSIKSNKSILKQHYFTPTEGLFN